MPPPRVLVKLTGARPGARFSFSARIFWSDISSISVIPAASRFCTVKVTGPASAVSWSSSHRSPVSVTATRLTPDGEDAVDAGKEALTRAVRKQGLPLQRLLGGDALPLLARDLRLTDVTALYVEIGEGRLSAQSAVQKIMAGMGGTEGAVEDLAEAATPMDKDNNLTGERIEVRLKDGDIGVVGPQGVDYLDISPRQMVSVATAMIPFLEHDDANRALMGANMQKQAVPLLRAESAYVATGMEQRAAYDAGDTVISKKAGVI